MWDRSGFESDDSSWADRALIDHFILLRSQVIKSIIMSERDVGDQSIQTIPCISLDEVPLSECPCLAPDQCTWRKSCVAIPNYLKIVSVTTIDGKETISHSDWSKVKIQGRVFLE